MTWAIRWKTFFVDLNYLWIVLYSWSMVISQPTCCKHLQTLKFDAKILWQVELMLIQQAQSGRISVPQPTRFWIFFELRRWVEPKKNHLYFQMKVKA